MNVKRIFNDGWEFAKSCLNTADHSTLTFEPVDLPHDWLIYNTLDLYENSIGWYRKKFQFPENGLGNTGEQILLYFDGVYMDSSLYVNKIPIGEWKYGYSSFEHDITNALIEGENEILLKVVHQSPNSRWYSGAGIYRNVWLKTRDRDHIVTDGIYVSVSQAGSSWQVEIETELNISRDARLSHSIRYGDRIIASCDAIISAGSSAIIYDLQTLSVEKPLLWSMDEPNLYQLVTELSIIKEPEVIESVSRNIGFRTILLDPDKGFSINGRCMKLNGVCEHHDFGALGAAFNTAALKRKFMLLREMGVNAIRTSHNMPAPELMDLADEMGFLVISEAFDMWERPKTTYDYARFFNEWAPADVKSWIKRDRNHPSLLMWSIGNEIYDTHADSRGQEVTRLLMELVQQYDPKTNARITIGSNYMPWENAQKCADILKVAGYNYAEAYYKKHHEEHPDWVIYGSETASTVQSRGIYHFPLEKAIMADDDEQCSSLGNSSTSWGAKSSEACIIADRDTPFSLGTFIWTGFDYIGEPTPYHTKNSYFGQIDTATFKKDSFYIYQAAWTDYKIKPMVHILPYWDFNEGQLIDVRVFSNAPKVELLLNGSPVGNCELDHKHGQTYAGSWKIPYQKGDLKAFAYDEDGNIVAEDVQRSFKDAVKVSLHADKETLIADGTDLIYVEITMEDEDGNTVMNANNRVRVNVTGAGRLIGLDNGDSTDYDQYKGLCRRLFSGKLMAIIGAVLSPGSIRIEVSSAGCEGASAEYEALPANADITGITARMSNYDMPCNLGSPDEIPVRKIELISEAGREFSAAKRDILVHAKIYPENASYREVEWSVVNDTGIKSNIAKVEAFGLTAKVTAIGDGSFCLRSTSRNGSGKVRLISQLEFTASGIGKAYKDPYGFICAGLYDYNKGEVGCGNEKGIATGRDGETQVGFTDIDFGPYGSDTITIPIFALSGEKYNLQIWEGMPNESVSTMLADVIYQKPSIWNVYQEETYKLSKKLTGISSICFVLRQKVHIKGFSFEKQSRAFQKNNAAACDRIYGDSYQIEKDVVKGIGNNVSLEFQNMDFLAEGTSKLVVYGRSINDKNTIQIRFEGEDGESSQLIEFVHPSGKQSESFVEQTFGLKKVIGVQKVTFLFLPGSSFDFGWFRFE